MFKELYCLLVFSSSDSIKFYNGIFMPRGIFESFIKELQEMVPCQDPLVCDTIPVLHIKVLNLICNLIAIHVAHGDVDPFIVSLNLVLFITGVSPQLTFPFLELLLITVKHWQFLK